MPSRLQTGVPKLARVVHPSNDAAARPASPRMSAHAGPRGHADVRARLIAQIDALIDGEVRRFVMRDLVRVATTSWRRWLSRRCHSCAARASGLDPPFNPRGLRMRLLGGGLFLEPHGEW